MHVRGTTIGYFRSIYAVHERKFQGWLNKKSSCHWSCFWVSPSKAMLLYSLSTFWQIRNIHSPSLLSIKRATCCLIEDSVDWHQASRNLHTAAHRSELLDMILIGIRSWNKPRLYTKKINKIAETVDWHQVDRVLQTIVCNTTELKTLFAGIPLLMAYFNRVTCKF